MSSCASRASCSLCSTNTSLCHWCDAAGGAGACHAIGSYYGCAVGVSCYQEDCMRKTPLYSPATPPSFLEFFELVILFVLVLSCAGFCINVGNTFRTATSTVTRKRDERYVSLGDVEDLGGGQKRVRAPTTEEQWSVPIVELTTETVLGKKMHCLLKGCCTCIVGTVGMLLVITCIVYPHAPNYSVCNSELNWQSLLGSLSSLTLSAEYEVAMSLRNPNIFAIRVDSVDAVFTFQKVPVASVTLRSGYTDVPVVDLVASSITDVVLPLTFAPDIGHAWAMNKANAAGTLQFEASFSVTGTVLGFYYFDIEIKDHVVDMSSMGDQSLCAKCNY